MRKKSLVVVLIYLLILFQNIYVYAADNDFSEPKKKSEVLYSTNDTTISEQKNSGYWSIIKNDFSDSFFDFKYIFSSITLKSSITTIGEVSLLTGCAFIADKTIDKGFENNVRGKNEHLYSFFNNFGTSQTALGISGLTYLSGLIFKSEDVRICGRQMAEALLLSGAVTLTSKIIIGRHRPDRNQGAFKFTPLSFQDKYNSLPSGHATIAFALATVASQKIDKWWAYIGCYGIASGTGIARMYYKRHWVSDVILGASIGTISALAVVNADKNRKNDNKLDIGFSLTGINIQYRLK